MGATNLKRRLDRIEKEHPPKAAAPQPDLSKLSVSEITFLESISDKMPIVNGERDLSALTDELETLDRIVVKVEGELRG